MEEALNGADVALLLRVQRERLAPGIAAAAGDEALRQYFCDYGLTEARRKSLKPAAVIMHPGPINRGVEIADSVADCPQSLILRQVQNGMAIRAAVLSAILTNKDGCA
jgi:aspartate carbamoyltransferase catalytic subunit